MNTTLRRRGAATVFVAVAAFAVPHPAAAFMPMPPSPVWLPIVRIGHTILTQADEYAQAPLIDKRRLHDEIVLLIYADIAAV